MKKTKLTLDKFKISELTDKKTILGGNCTGDDDTLATGTGYTGQNGNCITSMVVITKN